MKNLRLLCLSSAMALFALGGLALADDGEIVIGAGLVISGPSASYGTDGAAGIQVAVDELNETGGVLGRQIRVEYDDTGADPAKAVAVYRKYAAQDDIVAAMSISSMEFVALDPVAAEENLPLISLGSTIPSASFSPYTFRTNIILDKSVGVVLDGLRERGTESMAILYDESLNYTVSEMEAVRSNVEASGIELATVESFATGDQNFTLQLTRILQSSPDTIWVAAMTDQASLIISQARGMGISAQLIGGAGMNDPRIGAIGEAAQGVLTYALFSPNDERPIVENFVERFQAAHGGEVPSAYSALGYDAMMVVADALERAGKVDREALREALAQTDGFEGVNGPIKYEGSGDNEAQSPKLLVLESDGFRPAN